MINRKNSNRIKLLNEKQEQKKKNYINYKSEMVNLQII